MYELYELARGPLVWAAFILFVGGSLYRLTTLFLLARKKDRVVFEYMSPYYALRSLFHWVIPFASASTRNKPVVTLVAFVFHIALIVLPIFLLAHIILIKESWNIAWGYLPAIAADGLTLIVIFACIFFFVRRIVSPDVRFLSSAGDYLLLILVAAPFVTGFWASQQWAGYEAVSIAHMLTGELLLACIPFTRLSHMFFFPLTRMYAGSEFGAVRHAKDW